MCVCGGGGGEGGGGGGGGGAGGGLKLVLYDRNLILNYDAAQTYKTKCVWPP